MTLLLILLGLLFFIFVLAIFYVIWRTYQKKPKHIMRISGGGLLGSRADPDVSAGTFGVGASIDKEGKVVGRFLHESTTPPLHVLFAVDSANFSKKKVELKGKDDTLGNVQVTFEMPDRLNVHFDTPVAVEGQDITTLQTKLTKTSNIELENE